MLRHLFLAFALTVSAGLAAETPASEASIREVLAVTDARKLVDGAFSQVENIMKVSVRQSLHGRVPGPDEQAAMDKLSAETMKIMKEELSWDQLEPLYISIYQKSFTQEDIDGMLAFYKSPAGASVVKKMPVVMQQTMVAMQQRMGPMMQKLQAVIKQSTDELRAKKAQEAADAAAAAAPEPAASAPQAK